MRQNLEICVRSSENFLKRFSNLLFIQLFCLTFNPNDIILNLLPSMCSVLSCLLWVTPFLTLFYIFLCRQCLDEILRLYLDMTSPIGCIFLLSYCKVTCISEHHYLCFYFFLFWLPLFLLSYPYKQNKCVAYGSSYIQLKRTIICW